jgi:demethylmenaquinone methyltransferase / 2-methoxy-6-polyprenyl-1,4-benzoquinol methylase
VYSLASENSEMYSEAKESYDLTNHLMSFYTDSILRKIAADRLLRSRPIKVLDIATGTGDTALIIAEKARRRGLDVRITAIDANEGMVKVSQDKARRKNLRNLRFERGDALKLRYPSGYFDAVICTFALKNFKSVEKFAAESRRVLKNGGTFVLLDISAPSSPHGRAAFYVYYNYMKLFGAVTGKKLYRWLPESTKESDRDEVIGLIRERFGDVRRHEFLSGIAYMLVCRKG